MTLHHAVIVLEVITEITIGTIAFVVCDVACVGVFIGSVDYHCNFKFLPYITLNGSICKG
jgi:hypothetical protein